MQIIFVSDRLTNARGLTLTKRHVCLIALFLSSCVFALSCLLNYVTLSHPNALNLPVVRHIVAYLQLEQDRRAQGYVRANLDVMAVKLGEMQAQLLRLDALGDRLAQMAGVRPQEFRFKETPGRGGPAPSPLLAKTLGESELRGELERLSRDVEARADYLQYLELELFDQRVGRRLLPTVQPVAGAWNASSFGWRIDPFNGQYALHEGLDFISETGTPVVAAAGGVVLGAQYHSEYGNLIEIDHGSELISRYAHLSRMTVKVGQVLRKGTKIGEVGSTGRSTGSHLHFEFRNRGIAVNPARFLTAQR